MKIVRAIESPVSHDQHALGKHLPLVCADTARVNRGEPVYLPYPAHAYSLTPCLYIRLRGVCKAVDRQQAERYIDGMGSALHFCDETLLAELRSSGLPWTSALSFDRAIIAGQEGMISPDLLGEAGGFALTMAGVQHPIPEGVLPASLMATISRFSGLFTFNTGDWLLMPLSQPVPITALPARAQLSFRGQLLLDEHIR
ncbi:MAG: hypothetical protein CSA97_01325 [Bacteroidetes bacterium]|nr:MAG: hypothetical protein CSA97_01325 [Bacteroidota bacterium]